MTFPINQQADNDRSGRTLTSVSVSSLSISIIFVVLHCTLSILGFVPCLISVIDLCVNVKSLSMFPCGSRKWRDDYRAY